MIVLTCLSFFATFLRIDACRPVPRMDALINRRATSEPFDKTQDKLRALARPPVTDVRPI